MAYGGNGESVENSESVVGGQGGQSGERGGSGGSGESVESVENSENGELKDVDSGCAPHGLVSQANTQPVVLPAACRACRPWDRARSRCSLSMQAAAISEP